MWKGSRWANNGCCACREICVEGVKADVEGVNNIRSVNVEMKKGMRTGRL